MAKLPNVADLGAAQISGSRPTGSYDVSGLARGGEAIAAGGRALGKGIEAAASDVADVRRKQVDMQVLDAHSGAASELLDLHTQLQQSKDYANLDQQYGEKSKEIVDRWSQTIPDGRMREHYLATSEEQLARGRASVGQMAFAGLASTDSDARKATLLDIESKIGQDNSFLPDAMNGLGLRIDKAVIAGWETKERGDLEKRAAAVTVADRQNIVAAQADPDAWLASKGQAPRQTKAAVWAAVDKAAQDNGISPQGAARLVQIESGGNPNARTGSYYGLTQLSQSEFSKYNRIPGANIMDPEANLAAGFAKVKAEGDQFADKTGRQPTDFDRYMIHQQGTAGYESHLANPDAPAWQNMLSTGEGKQKGERWAKAAIWGNIPDQYKRQFGSVDNVTSGDFLKMWAAKYGTAAPTFAQQTAGITPGRAPGEAPEDHTGFHMLDPRRQMQLITFARTLSQQRSNDAMQATNLLSVKASNQYALQMEDAANGRGAMPSLDEIRSNPLIAGTPHEVTLTRQWDAANKQDEALQSALARFVDPRAGPFNPIEDNDKKQVDKIYQLLAGNDPEKELPALQAVVDRTGIVPTSAAGALRGALLSNSGDRVAQAAQMARNLMAKNPQIFTGVAGGNTLESAAVSFQQYTEHYGMTAQEAARKIIADNDPEYKAKVAARIKGEDVGEIIKKQLSPADLEKAFNDEGWSLRHPFSLGRPNIEFTEGAKTAAFSDYQEMFRDRYMETGNVDTAKAQAVAQLKKIWGVSHLNGTSSGTLMRFPPERAPAYADIPDVGDRIAEQAIDAIYHAPGGAWEDANGKRGITRDKIILTPTPGGQTAQAYNAGQPVPYLLSWFDKDGVLQTLNPGKAFVFDGAGERAKISDERRTKLEGAIEGADRFTEALGQAGPDAFGGDFGQPAPASERQPAAAPASSAPTAQDTYALPGNRRPGRPTLQ